MSSLKLPKTPTQRRVLEKEEEVFRQTRFPQIKSVSIEESIEENDDQKQLKKAPEEVKNIYMQIQENYNKYKEYSTFFKRTFFNKQPFYLGNLYNNFRQLAEYAYVNNIDKDADFVDYGMIEIILSILQDESIPNSLKEVVIIYICNVIRQPNTNLQKDLSDNNFVSIIFTLFNEKDQNIQYLVTKCFTYLAQNDENERNFMMQNHMTLSLISSRFSSCDEQTQKQLLKLLQAYCLYNFEEDDSNSIPLLIDIIHEHRNRFEKKYYKTLLTIVTHDTNIREYLINDTKNHHMITEITDILYSSNTVISYLILELLNYIVYDTQIFVNIDLISLYESKIFQFFMDPENNKKTDEYVSVLSMRLIGNYFVNNEKIEYNDVQNSDIENNINKFMKYLFSNKRDDDKTIIHSCIQKSKKNQKSELIIMLTQIIRSSSNSMINDYILLEEMTIIEDLVHSLSSSNIELICDVLSALAALFRAESNSANSLSRKAFKDAKGPDVIDDLKFFGVKEVEEKACIFEDYLEE